MDLQTLAGSEFEQASKNGSIDIIGLTSDSREVKEGFLFAAIPGTQVDGAKFIPSALEKGASALLVSSECDAEIPDNIPVLKSNHPRKSLALLASRFYGKQPETCIAVTGTNGKTSVASFVRQIWRMAGHQAASLGTIGLVTSSENVSSSHTTPEPVALHKMLAHLVEDGIDHLAVEASSHGLQQHRLDGVRIKAAAFTNISRDHLDYHPTFEDYFNQKMRLFSELLQPGDVAVIDMDSEGSDKVRKIASDRNLNILEIGRKGADIRLQNVELDGYAQKLSVHYGGLDFEIGLPLVGDFQVSNALVAAGLCLSQGLCPERVFEYLERLEGARGRLEYVAETVQKAPVFVDYAHTPDALVNALTSLRPYVKNRLIVLFGCGGDRDTGKRPLMGEAAAEYADLVYVTDDNPRSEDPAQIRIETLKGCPDAKEIGDRQQAINAAVNEAVSGDVILVAGKGHETGQIIGDTVIPFSDHEAVIKAVRGE